MNRRLKKAKKRRMRLAAVAPDGSPTVVTMDSHAHHRRFRFHVPPQAVEKQGLSLTVTSPHSRAVRRRFKFRSHRVRIRVTNLRPRLPPLALVPHAGSFNSLGLAAKRVYTLRMAGKSTP